ncbi:plasmid recombination protein [Agrobacterium pusense]|uniref:plasmid recombination protein n=1 Tax=Agrobacterium pusense TaxID=648995 RepID=UPI000D1B03B5|nr:plasmid recombination protein [Agrobacterium pusense]
MGFQFVHMTAYSRKGDGKGRSTGFVFGEARRDPSASLHVGTPAPPVIVHGMSVEELERLHDATAEAATTTPKGGKPRKVQKSQHTLMAVVASHPHSMEEVRTNPEKRREAEEWEKRTVAWLRAQYGDKLVSVIRHEDESHYHLHAYVLPNDPAMRASALHPGQTAKAAIMAAGPADGEDSKAMNKRGDKAYRTAMREWQDSYHTTVGVPCGLTRLGPQRRRLTRMEWQAEQTQARALRASLDRAAAVKEKIETHIGAKKAEVESLVSTAETEAAALRAEADAAKADAARCLAEAKVATDAAKAAHDAAVREQRKARSMMSRAREEAVRVTAAAARLQRLPSILRTVFDGWRHSKVADRIRAALESDMSALRERASSALEQAAKADAARRKAVERASSLDASLSETEAQRDALRREVARLRPPEPSPNPPLGPRMTPAPGRR